jgi:hypothetical protein
MNSYISDPAVWSRIQFAFTSFLADVPESEQAALLRELIALEIDYRRRLGEPATPKPSAGAAKRLSGKSLRGGTRH